MYWCKSTIVESQIKTPRTTNRTASDNTDMEVILSIVKVYMDDATLKKAVQPRNLFILVVYHMVVHMYASSLLLCFFSLV